MRNLKKFETETAYNSYIGGGEAVLPNVSLVTESQGVHYNPFDWSKEYLTFEILENTTLNIGASINIFCAPHLFSAVTIEYSTDKENWTPVTSTTGGTSFGPFAAGTEVYLKGDNTTLGTAEYSATLSFCCFWKSTGKFNVKGNIMSLIDSTGFTSATTLSSVGEFTSLFFGCSGLTDASKLVLPATALTENCYNTMFSGCTSLTTTPELPATTLANGCYEYMFGGCTSLTTAPELPAATLANSCYNGMFRGCTSLTAAPALPATTLTSYCYNSMFWRCTSITTAPELPATTLAFMCYAGMFQGCTSLITAPELPAATLANSCYNGMFRGCTSLTAAPALPATTLTNGCYQFMFSETNVLPDCSNIDFTSQTVVASGGLKGLFAGTKVTDNDLMSILPKNQDNKYCLPVTTLANSCYFSMFSGCTFLTTAPELPATTLTDNCYTYMFYRCTALTKAPELPATTLVNGCYSWMFNDCTNLNYIKCLATNISGTSRWVSGVAASGTFVKASSMTSWPRTEDGIPANWTVQDA